MLQENEIRGQRGNPVGHERFPLTFTSAQESNEDLPNFSKVLPQLLSTKRAHGRTLFISGHTNDSSAPPTPEIGGGQLNQERRRRGLFLSCPEVSHVRCFASPRRAFPVVEVGATASKELRRLWLLGLRRTSGLAAGGAWLKWGGGC